MHKLRIFNLLAIIITTFSLITACQTQSQPASFTDDLGRPVTLDFVPQRIVSHVPSITEMLYALNLGSRVVGVDDFSDYPPEAKQKPSVGNYYNPSIERIVALEPDLVLTDGHSQTIEQLDAVGIKYVVIDPKSIDGIFQDLTLLGKITGMQNAAKQLTTDMQRRMDSVTAQVKGTSKPKVLYIIDAVTDPGNPWTCGKGSFIDSLITMAGGVNIAGQIPEAYAQMNIEQIVNANPDIIILDGSQGMGDISINTLKQHSVWSQMDAVRNGKVSVINGDLTNPVPRIVEGLESMAKIIHPEKFK